MQVAIYTVSQVNTYVKSLLEEDNTLAGLYLSGEISNFTAHRSGHLYFSLKDDSAVIKAVMFKFSAMRLRFRPQNGMRVVVRGRVSLYERDGQYQLYADDIIPDGIGALNLAYEQLKERLEREGLFDITHKKTIPPMPETVAVITSPTGAALQDILNILARRYPLAAVRVYPVKVQGDDAPAELVSAVRAANTETVKKNMPDVIIIGRGGGSLEELWAFNDEELAREIFVSDIPVISAVGHETDFTICDFVADVRAPTPSAAAELAVPDRLELLSYVAGMETHLTKCCDVMLTDKRAILDRLTAKSLFNTPVDIIDIQQNRADNITKQLRLYAEMILGRKTEEFSVACASLNALSPLNVLSRGYSITRHGDKLVTSVSQVKAKDRLEVTLVDGMINCEVV